jgi:hypothetical protein
MLKMEVEMGNEELIDRLDNPEWDADRVCPDGLRIEYALANALGAGRPAHAMGMVRHYLDKGRQGLIALKYMLSAADRATVDREIQAHAVKPPFPGG